MAGRSKGVNKPPWPKADDGTASVFRFDPARVSQHEARRRMRAFLHETNPDGEGVRTRTVTVEIPADINLSELGWPEAILLAHLAFHTPFPLAAEYEPKGDSEEE
jgi:hypothetical protein